jgi:hypothetical protein
MLPHLSYRKTDLRVINQMNQPGFCIESFCGKIGALFGNRTVKRICDRDDSSMVESDT